MPEKKEKFPYNSVNEFLAAIYAGGISHRSLREELYHKIRQQPLLTALNNSSGDGSRWIEYFFNPSLTRDKTESLSPNEDFQDFKSEYKLNIHGFRGEEFTKEADLVVAGCSVTYGVGMDAEFTWGRQLAEILKSESFCNLSYPGISSEEIVDNVFKYVNEYGKPKNLVVLFPDVYRLRMISHPENIKTAQSQAIVPHPAHIHFNNNIVDVMKISKRPHVMEDIISPLEALHRMLLSAERLEVFCKAAGINLTWSTWSDSAFTIILHAKKFIKYFDGEEVYKNFTIRPFEARHELTDDCHSELKDRDPEIFVFARDAQKHLGTHVHAHMAEAFAEKIK